MFTTQPGTGRKSAIWNHHGFNPIYAHGRRHVRHRARRHARYPRLCSLRSQELAGSQRFGITTALIQSTRMVGGMFGTALVGMLVTRVYVHYAARNWPEVSDLESPRL